MSRWTRLPLAGLLPLALLVLVALVYLPGLSGGFLFDDYPNIVTNQGIQAERIDLESLRKAAGAYEPGGYGRPVATISFAIDHALHGKDPRGYKLSSLLVHLLNTLLVFLLGRHLLASTQSLRRPALLAALLAFAWACHPLQVSTVLYVVQRMETLSLAFVLMALLAYWHGRQRQVAGRTGWPWLLACAPLVLLGLLSKETAALFPAYTLALELTVLGFAAARPGTTRLLKAGYALATLAALAVFFAVVLPQYGSAEAFSARDFSAAERVLTQFRVLPMYLGWMLLPLPSSLTFFYDDYAHSTGWLSPWTTLAGALFLLGLLVAAWRLRHRRPLLSLGLLWFFAAHLLTSSVFALELVFEHRNYFALFGVLLVLADLGIGLKTRDGPGIKVAGALALVAGFALLCGIRAAAWGNPLQLAMELAAKNPDSPRASSDLATVFMAMSDGNAASPMYSFARTEFERGSRLPGASPLPEQGLILMAASTGEPVDPAWWDRFADKLERRPIGPQETMAVAGLLQQHYRGITLDEAQLVRLLDILVQRQAASPHVLAGFGEHALTRMHDTALANRMFLASLEQPGADPAFVARLLSNLVLDGHADQAALVLARARALGLDGAISAPAGAGPAGG